MRRGFIVAREEVCGGVAEILRPEVEFIVKQAFVQSLGKDIPGSEKLGSRSVASVRYCPSSVLEAALYCYRFLPFEFVRLTAKNHLIFDEISALNITLYL